MPRFPQGREWGSARPGCAQQRAPSERGWTRASSSELCVGVTWSKEACLPVRVLWGFCSTGSACGHLLASHLALRPSSLSWAQHWALLRRLWGRWCGGPWWAWWPGPLWWEGLWPMLRGGRGASWLAVAPLLLSCLLCSGQLCGRPCSPSSWCFCPNRVRLPLNFCYQVTRNSREEKYSRQIVWASHTRRLVM